MESLADGILNHQLTSFVCCLWFGVNRVERETGLAWNIEFADGQRVHLLLALVLVGAALQLLQTFGNVKRDVDEHSIDLRLHLVRSEEDVGFEVVNRLIDDVLLDVVPCLDGPAELSPDGKQSHVGDGLRVLFELRVISLE